VTFLAKQFLRGTTSLRLLVPRQLRLYLTVVKVRGPHKND